MVGQDLIISGMSTKIHQPRKRALNDPTTFKYGKSIALFGDDFQVNLVGLFLVGHPRSDGFTLIAAIGP